MKMATMGARAIGFSSFPSSSSCLSWNSRATTSSFSTTLSMQMVSKSMASRGCVACSAVQESSSPTATAETKAATPAEAKPSTAAEKKTAAAGGKEEAKAAPAPKAAAAKPKPAKAAAKPLPKMMEEDIIPSLKAILEAQDDLSELQLSFQDNKLEGSFMKKGFPYSFWAFFPDGALTGPKGFSLSSYGSGPSTVEPFLVDERKITARHVVFWVEKRLAAQGIIPVWEE